MPYLYLLCGRKLITLTPLQLIFFLSPFTFEDNCSFYSSGPLLLQLRFAKSLPNTLKLDLFLKKNHTHTHKPCFRQLQFTERESFLKVTVKFRTVTVFKHCAGCKDSCSHMTPWRPSIRPSLSCVSILWHCSSVITQPLPPPPPPVSFTCRCC